MKKKDGLLYDFMALSSKKKSEEKVPFNPYSY